MKIRTTTGIVLALAASALMGTSVANAADNAAAEALAKKEGCFKCHALDKKKEAKSFKEISAKYKGKADAKEKIHHQITSGDKVKLEDGTEEDHKIIKTKDKAQVDNLIEWIVSLSK